MMQDVVADAADESPLQLAETSRADDDQARLLLSGDVDDDLARLAALRSYLSGQLQKDHQASRQ